MEQQQLQLGIFNDVHTSVVIWLQQCGHDMSQGAGRAVAPYRLTHHSSLSPVLHPLPKPRPSGINLDDGHCNQASTPSSFAPPPFGPPAPRYPSPSHLSISKRTSFRSPHIFPSRPTPVSHVWISPPSSPRRAIGRSRSPGWKTCS